ARAKGRESEERWRSGGNIGSFYFALRPLLLTLRVFLSICWRTTPASKFKAGKAFLTVCLLILFSALAYEFVELNRKIPLPPLPSPNGNDDFVKAGQVLVGYPLYFNRTNVETLRAQVASNAEPLRLIRQGATKKCRISVPYSTTYIDRRTTELMSSKSLAWFLEAEARLAELEHQHNVAVAIHLETIR